MALLKIYRKYKRYQIYMADKMHLTFVTFYNCLFFFPNMLTPTFYYNLHVLKCFKMCKSCTLGLSGSEIKTKLLLFSVNLIGAKNNAA